MQCLAVVNQIDVLAQVKAPDSHWSVPVPSTGRDRLWHEPPPCTVGYVQATAIGIRQFQHHAHSRVLNPRSQVRRSGRVSRVAMALTDAMLEHQGLVF